MTAKNDSRLSLRALAALAGVAVSTASRALHNHPTISEGVRKRIQALARRHGYVINPLVGQVFAEARAGRGFQHLGTLAYVTSYETADWWRGHPTLRGFHAGVVERAKLMGHGVDEFWANEPGLGGRRLTQILRARGIGGVVLAPVPGRSAEGLLDWKHFSVALIGESVKVPRLNRAVPNQRHAIRLALCELTHRGYRRIGLVLRERYHRMTDYIMLSAFLTFQHGLKAAERVPVAMPEEWTREVFLAWFDRHRPEALIGAVGPAREWLAERGVQCPRDVGLVLLDWDAEVTDFAVVDQNATAVGAAAVDVVLGQMRRNERGIPEIPQTVLVDNRWQNGSTVRQHGATWSARFVDDEAEPETGAAKRRRAPM
jgi:LacI family transcriptional regulator